VVKKLSANFREATEIVEASIPSPPQNHILIRNLYLGINASDINFTNGKYTKVKPPFDAGFESIGEVVEIGERVSKFKKGDYVIVSSYGSFAEYISVHQNAATLIPSPNPELLPLSVSGLTASVALEQTANMTKGETVLVTAAAGGTGQFAVQLAKLAGNHVIGTCSSDDKVEFLKKLGCDRVINYKKEDLDQVLKKEYPKGVDIVYESVGGETFEICVNNLAVLGRLVIIGMVSGYASGAAWGGNSGEVSKHAARHITARLLGKSASVRGFFMNHFAQHFKRHADLLFSLYKEGKIKSHVDSAQFKGLDQVADALEYLYKGKNMGKLVVDIRASSSSAKSKL